MLGNEVEGLIQSEASANTGPSISCSRMRESNEGVISLTRLMMFCIRFSKLLRRRFTDWKRLFLCASMPRVAAIVFAAMLLGPVASAIIA